MKFTAEIQIMPLPEVIEPQGRTLQKHIHQLPIEGVEQVRVGKFIVLKVIADSESAAHDIVAKACEKLLVHPLIEQYSFHLQEIIEASEPEEASETEEAIAEEVAPEIPDRSEEE